MKRNEQMIIVGLVVVGLLVGFWFGILSPKRKDASRLQDQIDQLHSSLSAAQQDVATGEQAQRSFRIDYRRLVVLGKAVPADSEQASLLIQLQDLATRSGVEFQSLDLGGGSSSVSPTAAPIPTASSSTSSSSSSSSSDGSSSSSSAPSSTDSSTTTADAPPATEASAATLPLGASIGPAGLPIMPYDLTFKGGFFQVADFMQRLDALVHMRGGGADVRGRLLTVDGFTLTPDDAVSSGDQPQLTVNLSVTSYVTPADQGLTGGATLAGPASTTPTLTSSPTTAGSTTSTPTATTTSP